MQKKNVPYNTGKIEIGKYYVPPQHRNPVSPDMEDLQTALLGQQRHVDYGQLFVYIAGAIGFVVALLDLFVWRP